MSGPEVAKTPGGGAPGKEGKEPVANGHSEEGSNPFAEYMWMENEEEYNRQVSKRTHKNKHTPGMLTGLAQYSYRNVRVGVVVYMFSFVCVSVGCGRRVSDSDQLKT